MSNLYDFKNNLTFYFLIFFITSAFMILKVLETFNSLYFLLIIFILSTYAFVVDRRIYLFLFFFFIIFNVRADAGNVPLQAWEFFLFPAFVYLAMNFKLRELDNISLTLICLAIVALMSGIINGLGAQAFKSSFRWVEFLSLYYAARSGAFNKLIFHKNISGYLIFPLFLAFILSMLQFFYFKSEWLDVMSSEVGLLLYSHSEVANRLEANNYIFNGEYIRAMGVYISPPDLAYVFGSFILAMYFTKYKKTLDLIALIICFVCLLLTMGRSGLLYMVVAIVLVDVFYRKKFSVILYAFIFMLIALLVEPIRDRLLLLTTTGAELERILIWETVYNIWQTSPIYGVGGGQIPVLFNDYASVEWLVDRQGVSHSAYFGIVAEYGLIGFFLYIYLLVSIFRAAKQNLENGLVESSIILSIFIYLTLISISADIYQAGNVGFGLMLFLIGISLHRVKVDTGGNLK